MEVSTSMNWSPEVISFFCLGDNWINDKGGIFQFTTSPKLLSTHASIIMEQYVNHEI